MATTKLQTARAQDHGTQAGLLDDDHVQYLLLSGRLGGQIALGGTGAGDRLDLRGSVDTGLGRIHCLSPVEIEGVSAGDQVALRYRPTFTTGGVFNGGLAASAADVTVDNATFIWALLAETSTYRQTVNPGFAAFTLFNALPTVVNAGDVNLVQALVLNIGAVHERATTGTSTTAGVTGVNFVPQTRASANGATMSRTEQTAVNCAPTFSTVAGSTADLGTVRGLRCLAPAVALLQPQAGTETLTAYYGIDFADITFPSSGDKVVVRSALTDASDRFFLQNNGGARSSFGGGDLLDCGQVQIASDVDGVVLGAGLDVAIRFDGTRLVFDPSVGDQVRWQLATGSLVLDSDNASAELRMGYQRFALGQTGALGNQIGVFVAPAFTVSTPGEWSDFLLTQAGNLDLSGQALSNVDAWRINPRSITLSGGSIADIATLRVNGMTTSGIGTALTSALLVAGREVLRGSLNLAPTTPAQLTADADDYQGMGTGSSQRSVVRVSSDAARTITGFDIGAARVDDTIWLVNTGANNIVLAHENVGSAAANRIISPTGANLVLGADAAALLWYDDTDSRWRILYHTGT